MRKQQILGAVVVAASIGMFGHTSAMAGSTDLAQNGAEPPKNYKGQWWTNAQGCEYSRAGRPGETVWYIIVNTAKSSCPRYIVSHSPYNDIYTLDAS
ncbi:MAG: hypothetical protein AAGF53_13500 [Pseudomonadota bacterium]